MTLPTPHNPKQIEPALLTLREWQRIVDPGVKCHPSEAYDWPLATFKRFAVPPSDYPKVIRRLRVGGFDFEVRLKSEQLRYVKYDADDKMLRDEAGNPVYFTDEEVRLLGKRNEDHQIAIFHDGQQVATLQDEWGCVLVVVAQEYRRFGLGPFLHRIARTLYPSKPSGGFSPQGERSFARVHRWFVRNALANGTYRQMVREGRITMDRVREIIDSAKASMTWAPERAASQEPVVSDPSKWLLYAADDMFVVYDPVLRDLIADGWDRNRPWIENAIKATVHPLIHEDKGWAILGVYGGDTLPLRRLMLKIACGEAERSGTSLWLDPEDVEDARGVAEPVGEPDLRTGYRRQRMKLMGERVRWDGMAQQERKWRRGFDRYDEFRYHVVELADAKFRNAS